MIGNDIVDLGLAQKASDWKRKGYLTKIFTPLEQKLIEESKDSFKMLWRLWSMKESGYKLYLQSGGKPFYNPTKIECRLCSISDGSIEIGSFTAETHTCEKNNYLFSIAKKNLQATFKSKVFCVEGENPSEVSAYCHHYIIALISREMRLPSLLFQLRKSKSGAPILEYKDQAIETPISLSHHGLYGLVSYAVPHPFPGQD